MVRESVRSAGATISVDCLMATSAMFVAPASTAATWRVFASWPIVLELSVAPDDTVIVHGV